jgi:hypothetical protein
MVSAFVKVKFLLESVENTNIFESFSFYVRNPAVFSPELVKRFFIFRSAKVLVRKFIGLGYGLKKPNLLDCRQQISGYAHTFLNVIVVFLLPSAPNSYIRLKTMMRKGVSKRFAPVRT